jgi:hypothetical protein
MRRPLLACALVALTVPAAPATAAPGLSSPCGYVFAADPGDPTGRRNTGVLHGGPALLDDAAVRTGRLACSIQLDLSWHGAPDAARAVSPTSAGVAVLPPTPFELDLDPGTYQAVYLCDEVQVDGVGTFYWHAYDSVWTTDSAAPCLGAVTHPYEDPVDVPWEVIDPPQGEQVDPLVCPVLAQVFPPHGDVPDVWDCPPYA